MIQRPERWQENVISNVLDIFIGRKLVSNFHEKYSARKLIKFKVKNPLLHIFCPELYEGNSAISNNNRIFVIFSGILSLLMVIML